MTKRDDVEAQVRSIYGLRKKGDLEGIMASFTPNARFRMAGHNGLAPLTTPVEGSTKLRELMQQLVSAWDWKDFEIRTVLVDGNRAAVYSAGTMYYGSQRVPVETELFDLLTLEDGKIANFVQFCDTHAAAQAMGVAA